MSEQQLVEVKTIGEVERIVHASGVWDGTGPVEFSDNGDTWAEAWSPTRVRVGEDAYETVIAHPEFARVAVYRKDVRIPTTVTIRWDEQCPTGENPEWAEKWNRSPMRHFGRTARMVGYRQTFRDLLGDIVIEDEGDDRASAPEPANPEPRNWLLEFEVAQTTDELDEVVREARAARVFKPNAEGTALDRAWKQRRREIEADAWAIAEAPELSADELAQHHAFFEQPTVVGKWDRVHNRPADIFTPPEDLIDPPVERQVQYEDGEWSRDVEIVPAHPGKAPQDHLPGNRASRRAAKRKGRR